MKLVVVYPDAMLVHGKISGKKYFYVPGRDKGFLDVDDADVDYLLSLAYTDGCNCGGSSSIRRVNYFAKEINL